VLSDIMWCTELKGLRSGEFTGGGSHMKNIRGRAQGGGKDKKAVEGMRGAKVRVFLLRIAGKRKKGQRTLVAKFIKRKGRSRRIPSPREGARPEQLKERGKQFQPP